jgi:type I restriction enzyme S subunit
MSNKAKTTTPKPDGKPALTPKLRFPGFSTPWVFEPLSKVLNEHKIKNTAGRDVFSVSMESGIVNQIEHLGRSFAAADTSRYTIGRRFDVVYTKSPLKAFPFGIVKQCKFDGEVALSPLYGVFTPTNRHLGLMIEAYFEAPNRSKAFLSPLCQKGAKNTLQITNTTFLSGRLPLPTQPAEQKNIAECLSSVDELIAAHARKLDALKTLKKGLMQQLFPREGETKPRLRFPEFQNAGEWEEKKLGDVASFFKGKGLSKADIAAEGRHPCIRYGELYTHYGEVINEIISRTDVADADLFFSQSNDVIIPGSGETKLDIAKASCVMHDDVALGGDLNVIRTAHNGVFLSYYLNGPKRLDIAKVAQGHTVVHLYPSQLQKLAIVLPKKTEQKRIADCLTTLDDLIAAQTQKVEALKTHKKGLMQQLFPSSEEVA